MSMKAYSSYTVVDVVDGIQWQADATSPPANPKEGWAYYNTEERKSYIYDGEKWVILTRDGDNGSNFKIFTTGYTANQTTMENWAALGSSNWAVNESTAGLKPNDSIMFRCYNTTKQGYSYVLAVVLSVNGDRNISAKSVGLLDKGDTGTNGKDGADFEETIQYHQYNSYSTAPSTTSSSWSDTFPESWDNTNPYVWKRSKKVWNQKDEDGTIKTTYTTPELMSQLEVATIMAQKEGKTLDAWCVAYDVTVISGSQIATGTITADHINVNNLAAINANLGTVTSGEIKSPDYKKQGVAVWDVEVASAGLEYNLNDNEKYYNVSIGTCTDTHVVIPGTYEGLPVIVDFEGFDSCKNLTSVTLCEGVEALLENAFAACTNLTSITIPESVTYIGPNAFESCTNLTNITIPDSVTEICEYAFNNCSSLTSITIPDSVTAMYEEVFGDCSSLVTVSLGKGITYIDNYEFSDCSMLRDIIIPDSVTKIYESAFYNCSNLVEIVLPAGITYIGEYAFNGCTSLTSVYYKGTETEWSSITNDDVTEYLSNATIYYYSETAPAGSGNYWRYKDATGFKISCDDEYLIDTKDFKVTPDGHIEASSGSFKGHVVPSSGKIGNLEISGGGLEYLENNQTVYSLNNNGLIFQKSSAKIKVGNISLEHDENVNQTAMSAGGHFVLTADNNTKIELMTGDTDETASSSVYLYCQKADSYELGKKRVAIWLQADTAPFYPCEFSTIWISHKNHSAIEAGQAQLRLSSEQTQSGKTYIYYSDSATGIEFRMIDSYVDYASTNTSSTKLGVIGEFDQTKSKDNIYITGNLSPSTDAPEDGSTGYNLGASDAHWNTIFARKGEIGTSDRNVKKDIEPLSDPHEQIFDALEPVSYKFKVSNNNRTHTGFIAQDVKAAVENAGLTTQDFAAYCEWEKDDGTTGCGLRYGEFIALCVNEIQKLKKRVAELENTTK